jgi:hypothetical protein
MENQVVKTAYGIRSKIEHKKVVYQEATHSGLFYAFKCDCENPDSIFTAKDSIVNIKIFTLNDFDDTFTADSDISKYFKVHQDELFQNIDAFVKSPAKRFEFGGWQLENIIDLLLINPPTKGKKHQFKVQYYLSDGRILEQITTPIDLI